MCQDYTYLNTACPKHIDNTMQVYVDNMLVKSQTTDQHLHNLSLMFDTLKKYWMRLNPTKCAFGVSSRKFLCFMISQRGIEANLEKIKVVIDMERPKTQKDIQSLTRCVAALAGFISKATDKCAPFFKAFKGSNQHITWTAKCDFAFQELKDYTSKAPFLSKPLSGEVIFLYISISHTVVSSVLIQKPETAKLPIFYVKHSRMLSFSILPSSNWLSLLSSQRASSPLFSGSYYHRPN